MRSNHSRRSSSLRSRGQRPEPVEIEVEPGHDIAKEFEEAVSGGVDLLWISDALGHRHGIVMDKVAFIEVESAARHDVGFGSET